MQEATHIHNCWKRIGVWGQAERLTCPLLEQVIHCRNCQVFTQAGRQLLERNLPQEYRNDWTGVLAQKKEEELIGTLSVVIFRIEREWLAISTHLFEEIMSADQIQSLLHRIPHRKNPVLLGMINVHGEIWLCVSLSDLLGLERLTDQEENRNIAKRMMVMNSDNGRWVFPVDEIHGISRVHASTFQNVPVTVVKARSTFTKGIFEWQEKRVAFLDEDLLLYSLTRSVK